MIRRLPDWPARLTRMLAAAEALPTVWGSHDCALFTLDGIDAQAGSAHAARFRGRYATPFQAAALVGAAGLGAFAEAVAGEIGLRAVTPSLAGRGSPCVYPGLRGDTMGLILGPVIVSPGDHGLVQVGASLATQAWTFG